MLGHRKLPQDVDGELVTTKLPVSFFLAKVLTVAVVVVVVVVVVPSDPSFARIFHTYSPMEIWCSCAFCTLCAGFRACGGSVHTLHMPKPNVTRVQSATEWTALVHTLHMPKPNVTRVQSATEWTASVHTLHMPKPNVTRVQSATEWTASVHTLHMPKPNVTRVQSATEWTASVHTLHMLEVLQALLFFHDIAVAVVVFVVL